MYVHLSGRRLHQEVLLSGEGLTILSFFWLLCFCTVFADVGSLDAQRAQLARQPPGPNHHRRQNPGDGRPIIDDSRPAEEFTFSAGVPVISRVFHGQLLVAHRGQVTNSLEVPTLRLFHAFTTPEQHTTGEDKSRIDKRSVSGDTDGFPRNRRDISDGYRESHPDHITGSSGSRSGDSTQSVETDLEAEFYAKVDSMTPEEADMIYIRMQTELCRQRENLTYADLDEGQIYCNSTYDRVLCWPTTPAGEVAMQPCPQEFAGVKYLNYGNASKVCNQNGSWELKTDYNECLPEYGHLESISVHNFVVRYLYYIGFTLSIVSCIIALFIFIKFRSLWCARNKIHCHLIVTFVLRNLLWLIMDNVFPCIIGLDDGSLQWLCKLIVTLFNYAQVTNFFWMLVEGLYLHLMIVWAFSIERIKFWWYIVLGWGVPGVIVMVWAIVKLELADNNCWLPEENSVSSDYEYIYISPVLLVLLINVLFLISIVVVLITKLRASNTILTRQYKKAVKATVILLPLLGGTYILFLCSPGEEKLVSNLIFIYFNTILQSTQGLAVTTFYCFLNGEVRGTIGQRWQRWKEGRSISTRYTRASVATNCETLRASFQHGHSACNGQLSGDSNKTGAKNNNHDLEGALIHTLKTSGLDKDTESEEEMV